MINKVKRIIALLMITVMVVTSFSACSNDAKETTAPTNDKLTRGQWVTMLGESFGMDSYKNAEPYYKDVDNGDAIFPYVQSCYEWKVLSTGTDEFKPNEIATVGFVVSTATLAAELDYNGYMTGDNLNDALIQCAYENGVYDVKPGDKSLSEAMTVGNAILVVNAAVNAYMNATEEEHIDVEYMENVVNYTDVKDSMTVADNGNITMPQANAEGLSEGDIFYIEATIENPDGAAYKVVSKTQNADGTYTLVTEAPTFEEIFKEIDLYAAPEIKAENIIPVEGVTMTANTNDEASASSTKYLTGGAIDDLSSTDSETKSAASAKASTTFTFDFNFKDKSSNLTKNTAIEGALDFLDATIKKENKETINEDYDAFVETAKKTNIAKPAEEAKKTQEKMEQLYDWYQRGDIDKEYFKKKVDEMAQQYNPNQFFSYEECREYVYKKGYEVTGKIEVGLGIEAKVDFGWFMDFESVSVKANLNIVGEAKAVGKIEEELTIAKIVVPIGGVFAIEGSLRIYCELNGEIGVKLEFDNEVKVSYDDESGEFKKTAKSSGSLTAEASVNVEYGPKAVLAVSALGFDIADIQASAATILEAKASGGVEVNAVPLDNNDWDKGMSVSIMAVLDSCVEMYAPVLKVKIGGSGTILNKLGISAEFTLTKKEDAPFKYKLDPEPLSLQLYYKEILFDEEETTEETTTVEGETIADADVEYDNGIRFEQQVVKMQSEQSKELKITLPDGYTSSDVEWSSSDDSVATISAGKAKAEGEGYAYITVKTKDGKYSGKCLIIVE